MRSRIPIGYALRPILRNLLQSHPILVSLKMTISLLLSVNQRPVSFRSPLSCRTEEEQIHIHVTCLEWNSLITCKLTFGHNIANGTGFSGHDLCLSSVLKFRFKPRTHFYACIPNRTCHRQLDAVFNTYFSCMSPCRSLCMFFF